MTQVNPSRVLIHRDDLQALTAAVSVCASETDSEENHRVLAQELLGAALELERSLRAHTRDVLMSHRKRQASQGDETAQQLFDAMVEYAGRIRNLTAILRPSPYDPPDGEALSKVAAPTPRLASPDPEFAGRAAWGS